MIWLLSVSFIWAFSFGLIKGRLGGLDPVAVAFVRMAVASVVFLPFLKLHALPAGSAFRLAVVGAVQFGMMYILYLHAFAYLQAHEIALFTIFTPFYLALLDALLERRWRLRFLLAGVLAVAGGAIVSWQRVDAAGLVRGFLLVQASNLCFAAGQLVFRRLHRQFPGELKDHQIFAWLALGAAVATGLASLLVTPWPLFTPSPAQWLVLIYLGAIASGLGFFLWNLGATRVNAGTLSVFNNLKIPLGIGCSLVFFHEHADLPRLMASLALLSFAIWVVESGKLATGESVGS